jgi:16S rRNA (guanine1207-N2)-methyltransferase
MNNNIIERNERIQKVSQVISTLPERTIVVNDLTGALQHIQGTRWSTVARGRTLGQATPPMFVDAEGAAHLFEAAVIRLSTNKDQMRVLTSLLNSVLTPDATIWVVGGNDEGIKSFPKTAPEFVVDVQTVDIRQRARVLKGVPTANSRTLTDWFSTETIELDGQSIEWTVSPGVFAKGKLDRGTAFLLDVLSRYEFKRTHQIADFACGTGVIARWCADRFPEAHIDATDADSWSIELTKINAPTVHAAVSDGWQAIGLDRSYDLIISNPPVHIGKEQDYSVLEGLLRDAKPRLHYRGRIIVVVQHHVPLERMAKEEEYKIVELLEHNAGYKVWCVGMRK